MGSVSGRPSGLLRYGEDCPGGDLDNLPGFSEENWKVLLG